MPPSMFEPARATSSAAAPETSGYIQPNFNHGLRIWWAFFWPTALIGTVLLIIVNAWIVYVYQHSYMSGTWLRYARSAAPYLITYTVAFFVMYYILRKNFRHFRIGLLSNFGSEGAQTLVPTFARTARVWFSYSWRTFLIRMVVGAVAAIPIGFVVGVFAGIPSLGHLMSLLVNVAVDAAAGLFVIYNNILDEDIGDFRVALLPRKASEQRENVVLPAQSLPPQPPAAY
jgi:hypothetical protein